MKILLQSESSECGLACLAMVATAHNQHLDIGELRRRFSDIGAFFGGAAAMSGGLAMIPTPASGALGAFAVVTGVLGAAFAYADGYL